MLKNKLVVWGTNDEAEKVLIALELQAEAGKVMLYTFPESITTEAFVTLMMDEWRNGGEVPFPEGTTTIERPLSIADSLLPNDLKVERGSDMILRAQTEWHFTVLSSKLHTAYEQELQEFKEKVAALSQFDKDVFVGLRSFWEKVQAQSRERNLYREHADHLRDNINGLFDDMKKLRTTVKTEFMVASEKIISEFNTALEDIEKRIAAGNVRIGPIFDELKQIQGRYREARITNEHRNTLWDRIDAAYKAAKESKYGPSANQGSAGEQQDRRLGGMQEAIKRMEDGIRRDDEELNFQRKRVDTTEGQLEAQIRMAKIKMIEERLSAKREKLADMQKTIQQIGRQAEGTKEREHRRNEKETHRQKVESARDNARAEIAAGIKSKRQPDAGREENFMEAAGTVLGDVLMDALDTFKAVASVAAEKAGDAFQGAAEVMNEITDAVRKEVAEFTKDTPVAAEAAVETATETAVTAVETVAETATETAEAAVETVAETATETAEAVVETAEAAEETATETAETAVETATETAETAVETVAETAEATVETAAETVEATVETVAETAEATVETVAETAEATVETATETVEATVETATETVEATVETATETAEATVETVAETATETTEAAVEGESSDAKA